MKTQEQQDRLLEEAFHMLLNDPVNPMTPEDVDALIARRPDRYARFAEYGRAHLNTMNLV